MSHSLLASTWVLLKSCLSLYIVWSPDNSLYLFMIYFMFIILLFHHILPDPISEKYSMLHPRYMLNTWPRIATSWWISTTQANPESSITTKLLMSFFYFLQFSRPQPIIMAIATLQQKHILQACRQNAWFLSRQTTLRLRTAMLTLIRMGCG